MYKFLQALLYKAWSIKYNNIIQRIPIREQRNFFIIAKKKIKEIIYLLFLMYFLKVRPVGFI